VGHRPPPCGPPPRRRCDSSRPSPAAPFQAPRTRHRALPARPPHRPTSPRQQTSPHPPISPRSLRWPRSLSGPRRPSLPRIAPKPPPSRASLAHPADRACPRASCPNGPSSTQARRYRPRSQQPAPSHGQLKSTSPPRRPSPHSRGQSPPPSSSNKPRPRKKQPTKT
jgi:hypothetical protein